MIGLFDSGLGGLGVAKRVRERLPNVDILYFADQAHVPYGERSAEDLQTLLRANVAWLDSEGVELIAVACNTSCAIADIFGWPSSRVPILDLIDAAAEAVAQSGVRRVGVIGTTATIRTGAYTRRIRARLPAAQIVEVAAPALVPLVEAGAIEAAATRAAVAEVCAKLPRDLDALVYGCSHYPALDAHFARALAAGVLRIDPSLTQAQRVCSELGSRGIVGDASTRYVTNGDSEQFRINVARIMGDRSPHIGHAAASVV